MASDATVIVGVGQVRNRPGLDTQEWDPREPAQLMAEAVQRAAVDAGLPRLAQEADLVGAVPALSWMYEDLPRNVAQRVGASPDHAELLGSWGGESPIQLLNQVANRIAEGETRIAILCGAEAVYSRRRARKEGRELPWKRRPAGIPHGLASVKPFANPLEQRHGVRQPIEMYPLYENALRAEAGRSIEEHQVFVSRLMERYSEVAARNPYSWFPDPRSAEDIRRIDDRNRWICFPYPKLMNALMEVDQSAAVILMSETEAARLGIPPERRVYYLGGAGAHDAWSAAERVDLVSSPAYAEAARQAQEHAAIDVDDVDLFDLYSCFPSAVQFAQKALGLAVDDRRSPTQTGGLAHHGGPGNNYAMHGLANLAANLRDGDGRIGWVSGLGMSATKHAIAVLSTDRARRDAADGRSTHLTLDEQLRTGPELVERPEGTATIETYTLSFDREGAPEKSMLMLRTEDGRRTMANGLPVDFTALVEDEAIGRKGRVTPGAGDAPNRFELGD